MNSSESSYHIASNATPAVEDMYMDPGVYMDDLACYVIDKDPLMHTVCMGITVFIVIGGIIGNTINVAVFTAWEEAFTSSNLHLLLLAIVDTLYLLTTFLSRGLTNLRCLFFRNMAFDVFNRSTLGCQLLQYLQDNLSNFSACIVLSFTIERVLACYWPVTYKTYCTARRAGFNCLILFVVIFSSTAGHHFICIGRPMQLDVCTVLPERERGFFIAYLCEMVIFRILPVVGIAASNIAISIQSFQRRSFRKQSKVSSKKSNATNLEVRSDPQYIGINSITADSRYKLKQADSSNSTENKSNKRERKMNIAIILFCISTTYVLCFIPLLLHFMLSGLTRMELLSLADGTLDIMQMVSTVLYITGFSLNIFLYTLASPLFRARLLRIFTCFKSQKDKNPEKIEHTAISPLSPFLRARNTISTKRRERYASVTEPKQKQLPRESFDTQMTGGYCETEL